MCASPKIVFEMFEWDRVDIAVLGTSAVKITFRRFTSQGARVNGSQMGCVALLKSGAQARKHKKETAARGHKPPTGLAEAEDRAESIIF